MGIRIDRAGPFASLALGLTEEPLIQEPCPEACKDFFAKAKSPDATKADELNFMSACMDGCLNRIKCTTEKEPSFACRLGSAAFEYRPWFKDCAKNGFDMKFDAQTKISNTSLLAFCSNGANGIPCEKCEDYAKANQRAGFAKDVPIKDLVSICKKAGSCAATTQAATSDSDKKMVWIFAGVGLLVGAIVVASTVAMVRARTAALAE